MGTRACPLEESGAKGTIEYLLLSLLAQTGLRSRNPEECGGRDRNRIGDPLLANYSIFEHRAEVRKMSGEA